VAQPRLVVLFDLDLTLLRNPLDREVIAAALDEATGETGILDTIDFSGRSDRWLVNEVAARHDYDRAALFERYREAYVRLLRETLATLPPSTLPGAPALLDALRVRGHVTLGVATGNMRTNALAKIEHAGLTKFFSPLRGGFGDDHDDRANIVRAAALDCGYVFGGRLVVVGDTVHDVRAALAAGATAVGVATGHASAAQLAEAGADVVLPDLVGRAPLDAILG
jgi:phosphoglycolate phosphatase